MLISYLTVTGGALAGYLYVGRYTRKQKTPATLGESLASGGKRKRIRFFGKPKESLIKKLVPDAFVPPSPKVQSRLLYTDKSPWKDQVVPLRRRS